jgi:hypothetical protein
MGDTVFLNEEAFSGFCKGIFSPVNLLDKCNIIFTAAFDINNSKLINFLISR